MRQHSRSDTGAKTAASHPGEARNASSWKVPWNGFAPRTLWRPGTAVGGAVEFPADKAAGRANEAIGKAKQGVGNAVGSNKLQAEGAAQELKGDFQKATGGAKAAVKEVANIVANAVKKKL